ncbi:sarcosine oxidase subunit alpha family protein [Xanthobacter dioxanivorans]|uniref:Sarcosine oxidase subunit alpha family protein n=1 Tax=Xanthobacter dioxanivorans TaxID=2528964 RepID=A0A974PRZ2_9HYPH|nr:sarcosine oxidase subunit alpha family protein [Xanthobacter dioxanivorans]QRG08416.1 sarcosine oxidase subunit alpha family protein [Xanthobacter dioxanivorans]
MADPQPFRLPTGGRVDRTQPLGFTFNGQRVAGLAGDTVASALLANGIHLVGRSFKYHRPRGILTHGSDEPNALLDLDRGAGRRDPNNRATMVEACAGLVARSQNHWPTLEYDVGAVNDLLAPILVAGFYYKTFKWPRSFWHRVYEPLIRAAAGLGVAPHAADAERYAHRHAHCDVLVVGAGPAGLAAALAASEHGRRVILADEQPEPGGTLLHDAASTIEGKRAIAWRDQAVAELERRDTVTVLPRTTAFGYYNHNHVALAERLSDHLASAPAGLPRERLWQVRAREVVLATGAHERPLAFAGNDRPGILLAESIRVYLQRYAVAVGRSLVFATNGASAYQAAVEARTAGLAVTVVDTRPEAACGPELARVRGEGIEVLTGHTVVGSLGRSRVRGLLVAPVSASGTVGQRRTLACDAVGLSGGWTPAVHLHSQSRGQLDFRPDIDAFVPGAAAQRARSAGACNGAYDLPAVLAEGWQAGARAAGEEGARSFAVVPSSFTGFAPVRLLPTDADPGRARAFLDFQNDVTAKDIRLAVREGFESVEHVKRYTTTGMATDQGKTSNMAALGLIAEAVRRPIPQVGTTTFRAPYTPVSFGAIVGPARGALFDPIRTTPIDDWAQSQGAVFEPVGLWRRARSFPRRGEDMRAAVARECRAVRHAVGLFDASTLGKIEVTGPDALEFLERIYASSLGGLEPGMCGYALMLGENGFILDDGIVGCLAPDLFHVTTSSGGAPRVFAHMEDYLQTEWSDLRVHLTSTTEQWGVVAVQGPRAAEVIAPLVEGIDLAPAAFPPMAVREGTLCGVPLRLFRLSFTGELGYEINVPSGFAREVWDTIWERGQGFGMVAYGTEATHVLRAERGFLLAGHDTDGTVTPDDAGLSWAVSGAKADFVGKRSLRRPDMLKADRRQLVGLLTEAEGLVLDEGAQIVADPNAAVPVPMLGHVTSSYWSETCGRSIALALVSGGRGRMGEVLHATTPTGFAAVRVVPPVFFDPEGTRVHGGSVGSGGNVHA